MNKNIQTPKDLVRFLEEQRGNTAQTLSEGIVGIVMGSRPVIMTMEESKLTISCEVSHFDGSADPEELLKQSLLLLKQNVAILPYAYAMVPGENDESAHFVLIDSLMVGDLSEEELGSSLDYLRAALVAHDKLFG